MFVSILFAQNNKAFIIGQKLKIVEEISFYVTFVFFCVYLARVAGIRVGK